MKHYITYIMSTICITLFLIGSLTLFNAYTQITNANENFENFLELYRSSDYNDKIINYFESEDYLITIDKQEDHIDVSMTYSINVIKEVLTKQIEARLLK